MNGALTRDQYLAALQGDVVAFRAACDRAGLGAAVPGCPGWTVADLLWHVTEVHDFWSWVVQGGHSAPDGYVQPARPADGALGAMYDETSSRLIEVLAAAHPDAPVWTWSHDHSAGFVLRRMAHETAVHRCDAEAASGAAPTMDGALASDGIDEFLEHFVDARPEAGATVGGSVHLHCTDVAGEWTLRPAASGWDLTREHAKGDAAMRGTANDLLMVLWRRSPLTAADIVGDADVAARFVGVSQLT